MPGCCKITVAAFFLLVLGSALFSQAPVQEKTLAHKVWSGLQEASEIEVFLFDPAGQNVFAGEWKYLGKCTAKGPGSRQAIINALDEGVKAGGRRTKGKFLPQFGIRATSGGTTVELVIDFDSGAIRLVAGKERGIIRTSGSPKTFFENLFKV